MQFHYSWRDKQTKMNFSRRISQVKVSLCMITIHYPCNLKAVTKSSVLSCDHCVLDSKTCLFCLAGLVTFLLSGFHSEASLLPFYHFFINKCKWQCLNIVLLVFSRKILANCFHFYTLTPLEAAVVHSLVLCHNSTNK